MDPSNCKSIDEILKCTILKVIKHDGSYYVYVNPRTRYSGGTYCVDEQDLSIKKMSTIDTVDLWGVAKELSPDEFRRIMKTRGH